MANTVETIKCIVVDDAALMRATIRQLLESDPQVEVIDTAGSGPVALQKIREQCPDVVTMDIEMPGMDGFDILKLLRNTDETKDIPVIALSANAMPVQVQKGLDAGFRRYLTKPIKANQVLEAVGEMLGLEL